MMKPFDTPRGRLYAIRSVRLLATFVLLSAGLSGISSYRERVAEIAHLGFEPAPVYAILTTAWLLAGSLMIFVNRAVWLGAGLLILVTALTIPVAHAFWSMSEPDRTAHLHMVIEYMSLMGGLLAMAILGHKGKRR